MRRPDDHCPYPKPFSEYFDDCPAFQARQFIPLDTLYQPLEPVLTCRHLETRPMTQRHRWYGACALGTSEARSRWARQVGLARLERIRAMQRELGAAIASYTARLWVLKGQQLRAFRDGADAGPAAVDMPIDAAGRLIQVAIDRFIDTKYAAEISFEVPDDILQRFPEPVRTFFRPAVPERPVGDR